MKTNVEIPDLLYEEACTMASEEGSSLEALIEAGLRKVLEERKHLKGFRLRRVSFSGNGLQEKMEGARWDRILEMVYENRGGAGRTGASGTKG